MASRVLFAMSRDGLFWRGAARSTGRHADRGAADEHAGRVLFIVFGRTFETVIACWRSSSSPTTRCRSCRCSCCGGASRRASGRIARGAIRGRRRSRSWARSRSSPARWPATRATVSSRCCARRELSGVASGGRRWTGSDGGAMSDVAGAHGYVTDASYAETFFRELSPTWLNYVAALNGAVARPLDTPFRYLELGCGFGGSTVVNAGAFPHAEFHGCDVNPAHVAGARRHAAALDLGNVHFHETTFAALAGRREPCFDFIVLHGVYSWVDAAAREAGAAGDRPMPSVWRPGLRELQLHARLGSPRFHCDGCSWNSRPARQERRRRAPRMRAIIWGVLPELELRYLTAHPAAGQAYRRLRPTARRIPRARIPERRMGAVLFSRRGGRHGGRGCDLRRQRHAAGQPSGAGARIGSGAGDCRAPGRAWAAAGPRLRGEPPFPSRCLRARPPSSR